MKRHANSSSITLRVKKENRHIGICGLESLLFLLFCGSLANTSQSRASTEAGAIFEEDKRNEGENGGDESKDETSILRVDVVEELAGEERSDGTKSVTEETLSSDSGGRVLAITIGGVRIAGLDNEEDTGGDGCEADDGADPMDEGVLGEGINEETDGKHGSTNHSSIKTSFRNALACLPAYGLILANLQEIEGKAKSGTNTQRDIGKTRDTLTPAMMFLEGDGNDRQEKEGDTPGEGNPETKDQDNRLSDKHLDGLDTGGVKHLLDVMALKFHGRLDTLVAKSGTENLSTLLQIDATTGFLESESDEHSQRNIRHTLDTFKPSPAKSLVNETRIDGGSNSTEDGDESKTGHGDSSVFALVHIGKCTANQDGTNTAEKTFKNTENEDCRNVLAESQTDERAHEENESTGVDDATSNQFAEWCKEKWRKGASEVETEETELT